MFMIRLPMFLAVGMRKFTQSGYRRASAGFEKEDLNKNMKGKVAMVTGGNQGIGYAASLSLAKLGFTVHVVCRNAERGKDAVEKLKSESGNPNIQLSVCDVSSLSDIKRLAAEYVTSGQPLHVLVNNAGVMVDWAQSADGFEINFATNTLGSYAMARAFEQVLKRSSPSRVIFVASGGALTESLVVDDMEGNLLKRDKNFGQVQYARDKRRQLVITEQLAKEWADSGVDVYAMHPGWVDTHGVQSSMPDFRARFQSSLRTLDEGADTIVWLSVQTREKLESGGFYLDRSPQSKHLLLSGTSYSEKDARDLMEKLDAMVSKTH